MSVEQRDFGFPRSYQIDINPPLPSTGLWLVPTFTFGKRGNETLTIRVMPDRGEPWIASFHLETRAGLNGVYACPDPGQLMVLAGVDGFLLRADDPGATTTLPIHPTVALTRPAETDLLVVGSFTDAVAVDRGGVRWVTDRLFLDDFEFVGGMPGRIVVRGTFEVPGERKQVELDPANGRVLGGGNLTR